MRNKKKRERGENHQMGSTVKLTAANHTKC